MPGRLPASISPGQVFSHTRCYRDAAGDWKVKYLLVLAGTPGEDVIYRLLTRPAHGRPKSPPCRNVRSIRGPQGLASHLGVDEQEAQGHEHAPRALAVHGC
jgi:hypothetical protein